MNTRIATYLIIFLLSQISTLSAIAGEGRKEYYDALRGTDSVKINRELSLLEKSVVREKDAYKGALLMKKSELVKSVKDKLSKFKSGRKLLQAAILADSANAEYRFLRLTIQENCPDFLNYHSHKEEDAKLIGAAFKALPPDLRQIILEYAATSKTLKPESLPK